MTDLFYLPHPEDPLEIGTHISFNVMAGNSDVDFNQIYKEEFEGETFFNQYTIFELENISEPYNWGEKPDDGYVLVFESGENGDNGGKRIAKTRSHFNTNLEELLEECGQYDEYLYLSEVKQQVLE